MPVNRRKQASNMPDIESPFSDFLDTNLGRLPSLQEAKVIRELVQEKTAHLALLNSRVPRRKSGKKTPPKLLAELNVTRRFIKFHRALVAPWRCLPAEILSEIFALSLFSDPIDPETTWNDDRSGTLLVCKICRHWRHIAISTPSLWTILSISLAVSPSRGPLDWVPLWLDRSRSLAIHVQVEWDGSTPASDLNLIASSVVSHIHHIRTLVIDGLDYLNVSSGPIYPRITLPPPQSIEAPFLTTLDASLPPGSDYEWVLAVCQAAPLLTSLDTTQLFLHRMPVSQLTRLHVEETVPINEFLHLLKDAPGLQDVALDLGEPSAGDAIGDIIVAEGLSKLEVTSHHHLGLFFDRVRLPGLTEIEITQIDRWPQENFIAFLSRSSCTLKRLAFAEIDIHELHVLFCLFHKSCETLENLAISHCGPYLRNDAVIQYLTYRQAPFPHTRLQTIELVPLNARDGLLANLAESRILPLPDLPSDVAEPGHLVRLHLSWNMAYFNPDDFRRIRDLETKCEIEWMAD
ncbi:hypothetical protein DFH07DRAFT_336493 [Mycena maculata]|uniref:F-box domain-containing protein n=1 Tax=Mycena maculata TaxID=230809 RepID=A0AAD7HDY1_9AGAR|nr:hypothetical protein DFH07DRAFT_336493 [Mycena maculata]